MTTPTTNIGLSHIQAEFPGGSTPISLSQYYRGGARVPIGTATSALDGVPISTSGLIRIGMFRGVSSIAGVWVNQTVNPTARQFLSSAGTSSAALVYGGTTTNNANSAVGTTQSFNGTSWSASGSMNVIRSEMGGAGSSTAALACGGFTTVTYSNATETSNGTSWTTGTNQPGNARTRGAAAGTDLSNCLSSGGVDTTGFDIGTTASYNSGTWTTRTSCPVFKYSAVGIGTGANALVAGGDTQSSGVVSTVHSFVPTGGTGPFGTWTAQASLLAPRGAGGGSGTVSSALIFGGGTTFGDFISTSESFNGTTWSGRGALNTARRRLTGEGTSVSAFSVGGMNSSFAIVGTTETYTE